MHALIGGRRIGYTDEGTGTPVVLLHAFPLNRAMWEPQIRTLARRVRVIAVDLRGHGESDPTDGAVTLAVILDMHTRGFEGQDRTFLVVTKVIKP